MVYKDKDRQREANRQAKMRQRAREGMTITLDNVIPTVIPKRTVKGNIRVSKPSDADYVPQCETTRAFVEGRDKRPSTAKRGKDIQCFEDLPLDVQATINRVSESNEEKAKRTAIAIKYQHCIPSDGSYKGFIDTLYDPKRINSKGGP